MLDRCQSDRIPNESIVAKQFRAKFRDDPLSSGQSSGRSARNDRDADEFPIKGESL